MGSLCGKIVNVYNREQIGKVVKKIFMKRSIFIRNIYQLPKMKPNLLLSE